MDGIADMGGAEGWGRVPRPIADEPTFPEKWQGRAFAMALLATQAAGWNLDAFRHALERLTRSAYLDDGYFGRWLNGAELILTDSGLLAESAVRARAANLRGAQAPEPSDPVPARPKRQPSAPGQLRTVPVPPAFALGAGVRTKKASSPGHTRLPRYVRGHVGVVTAIQPAHVFPDTNAHFRGKNPQHVYTVGFDSRELWGADAERFTVSIELFETYLESP
ncbi:nitrile hydratase subunit beta [Mycolicibacterium psychrotolerans]|uniref:Nitrile hydratase subunit beta n=1 Tax=Mycolicibacterium psychrotolerans TaxID=216929 RepID=A0A7I7M8V7_9MYCO|nr:nitrile hydratase subunit beta [Mycolicibacterium psychrotolerans]BBX68658.1 nitrile hydratase [Mycolicibacterium psychrotolerans]